jgi:hypothetical protein
MGALLPGPSPGVQGVGPSYAIVFSFMAENAFNRCSYGRRDCVCISKSVAKYMAGSRIKSRAGFMARFMAESIDS